MKDHSAPLIIWVGLLILAISLQGCATTELRAVPAVHVVHPADPNNRNSRGLDSKLLKVITFNIAHGRGNGLHQLLQSGDKARSHLDMIVTMLKEQRPDVVALQEADGPSFWSGTFDHVEYIATHGLFSQYVHGSHTNGLRLSYGTALISNLKLMHPETITFDPELSLPAKGFVVATMAWPGNACVELDAVSVHLDFSSKEIRQQQAAILIKTLRGRNRPVVVMGDFNATWGKDSSVLRLIASELGLLPYQADQAGLETFARLGRRLDWILISPEFEFKSYKVINSKASDHQPVVAELALNQEVISTESSVPCPYR